MGLGKTS